MTKAGTTDEIEMLPLPWAEAFGRLGGPLDNVEAAIGQMKAAGADMASVEQAFALLLRSYDAIMSGAFSPDPSADLLRAVFGFPASWPTSDEDEE